MKFLSFNHFVPVTLSFVSQSRMKDRKAIILPPEELSAVLCSIE